MFTPTFIKDMAERAAATFAQGLLAVISTDALSLFSADLLDAVKVAVAAAVLSVIKSVAAAKAPFGDSSASLVDLSK